jgi:hypothetical protein
MQLIVILVKTYPGRSLWECQKKPANKNRSFDKSYGGSFQFQFMSFEDG